MSEDRDAREALAEAVRRLGGSLRAGQAEMADRVEAALDAGSHLLVQAGTGTGKSLGYLVPVMLHAATAEERAVVSTATLALQRQVMTKDAPVAADAVEAVTGVRPSVALLKGWQNYLCRHRLAGGYPDDDADTLFSAGAATTPGRVGEADRGSVGEQIVRLREWAAETATGDRDDLIPGVSDRAWAHVSVSRAECLGPSCPLHEECFPELARALGLTVASDRWDGVDVGTPFDYARQGILYAPTHLPRPGRGICEAVLDELLALTEASGGGMLGLFSSRRAAAEAAEVLRGATDLTVYAQGDDQLSTLVEAFAADEDACLVGTLSLWQGVDVPGRTCRLVIIDRIPFPRPDDPVAQARSEAVAAAGGNGFMSVSATHAALLLAQGAGRLIRRPDDRGVVAVLDPRLRTARYGSFLARSMPALWPTGDRDTVLGALGRLARSGS